MAKETGNIVISGRFMIKMKNGKQEQIKIGNDKLKWESRSRTKN